MTRVVCLVLSQLRPCSHGDIDTQLILESNFMIVITHKYATDTKEDNVGWDSQQLVLNLLIVLTHRYTTDAKEDNVEWAGQQLVLNPCTFPVPLAQGGIVVLFSSLASGNIQSKNDAQTIIRRGVSFMEWNPHPPPDMPHQQNAFKIVKCPPDSLV